MQPGDLPWLRSCVEPCGVAADRYGSAGHLANQSLEPDPPSPPRAGRSSRCVRRRPSIRVERSPTRVLRGRACRFFRNPCAHPSSQTQAGISGRAQSGRSTRRTCAACARWAWFRFENRTYESSPAVHRQALELGGGVTGFAGGVQMCSFQAQTVACQCSSSEAMDSISANSFCCFMFRSS